MYELSIDEETDYVHGVDVELTMTTRTNEAISMTTELVISDHDEPIDIELPDAADAADSGASDTI